MFDLIPFERRTGNMFDYLDRMMNDSFFGGMDRELSPCRTDILDKGDKYVLKADMPGFNKEDIKIDIAGNQLTITAEHKEETKDEQKNYIRRERRYGALTRSFDIEGINADGIGASYENGVLQLELPKMVETKPAARSVEIK